MNSRNILFTGLLTIGLFSCAENTESAEKENTGLSTDSEQASETDTVVKTEDQTAKKEVPTVISFDEKSNFNITTKNAGTNEATGTPNVDIFLNNAQFEAPIKLARDLGYLEMIPGESGIPSEAVYAYNTWFAGGGEVHYGMINDGVLQIYRKFEDEGMTEPGQFSLYREIDPNVQTKKPDYYISYNSDDNTTTELMIAFTEDGKALYAKYYGQKRHIELRFAKDASEGRNIVEFYDEIVNGEVNGNYKLSHSGNWDYAEYTNAKSGKKFGFTINHDVTIMNDTYRTVPSF